MATLAPVGSTLHVSALLLVVGLLTACIGGSDDGADEAGGPDASLAPAETFASRPMDPTIPDETLAGEDGGSVAEALADDTVTADELAAAYEAYVACLVEGGGAGRYAYDLE